MVLSQYATAQGRTWPGPITYSPPQGLHCAGLKPRLFAVVSIITFRSYEAALSA